MLNDTKIRRPSAFQSTYAGDLPPTPLRPGPLTTKPWSQYIHSDSIRILGPYFGPKGPNPATGSS